ncbi:MAG: hydrogenase formation protein HypD [Ignavibacteriaceae bacterium]|jgi:hydrogenase expression/formation protein HypD|nr:hydrogenase formation protein HypD [Ignavibacteriaceae bacterium]
MKYLDEFRDGKAAKKLSAEIKSVVTKPWQIMEICGGQTHSILKYSIEEFLPEEITLIHGPGCPVCVTPLELIDKAIAIAQREDVIFTSFGDMLRVPGSKHDLLSIKAKGGNVKMVYSPLDALKIAENNPDKKVIFFAVGFETTAPANAMSVIEAKRRGIKNYSILCSHVLVPPAIEALLSSKNNNIQGFLAAGHVCAVMGYNEYFPIAEKYNVPIVVTGFEPIDILQGILLTVKQLEDGKSEVQNQYSRVVTKEGNLSAQKLLGEVFERTDRKWRGIGNIPSSGFKLKDEYSDYDAEKIFKVENIETEESPLCIAGEVLQGIKKPIECTAFGKECTPERPLGAPMVSTEGACAAYFHYGKRSHPELTKGHPEFISGS